MSHPEKATVLIVDDTPDNIRVILEALRNDYAVLAATNGQKALDLANGAKQPDIILLDVMMPEMDGYEVCRRLKDSETTRDIPIIFITALGEADDEAKGLALGAVDYIVKPFNPAIMKARLANHLALRQAYRVIQESQRLLADDLSQAANYVVSLLPPELTAGPVRAQWRFIPTSSLGGDALGYHFPDKEHLAFYLLDVCSHGVGPALLSVQVLNVVRNQSLPGVDFLDPSQVLSGLNGVFPMDRHNDLYFTMIYGVYGLASRKLTLAAAGHPPALLFSGNSGLKVLSEPNLFIGAMPGVVFKSQSLTLEPDSSLYIFSDGVYEILKPDDTYWRFAEFTQFMSGLEHGKDGVIDDLLAHVRKLGDRELLDDDFSMLKLVFP